MKKQGRTHGLSRGREENYYAEPTKNRNYEKGTKWISKNKKMIKTFSIVTAVDFVGTGIFFSQIHREVPSRPSDPLC